MNFTGPVPSAPPLKALPDTAVMTKEQRLKEVLAKYEISIASAQDLVALEGYEIVFVIDDSGSMQLPSEPVQKRTLGQVSRSRWDELCETVKLVAELACIFDPDGVDLYFLNRPELRGVTSPEDPNFLSAFAQRPSGTTPLTETVSRVITDYSNSERPVLLMIATDGEPDGGPRPFMELVRRAIAKQLTAKTFKFQILACTDDDASVAWLDNFDRQYKEVDVTDDYHTERAQVLQTGRSRFTRSDWVIKALLGPILQKFDDMDEQRPNDKKKHKSGSCGCAVS